MTLLEIAPTVANNIVQIENNEKGYIIDGAIYICPNEVVRLERLLTPIKMNYLNLSDEWKLEYETEYNDWVSGAGSGVPGDPNGFFIDVYAVILGIWKLYYIEITELLALIATL